MFFNTSDGAILKFGALWQPENYSDPVPIDLMDDEHVLNTISLLQRKITQGEEREHPVIETGYLNHNIEVFNNELVRRQG